MSSGVKAFCFLIFLPALAAAGHDAYYYYEHMETLPAFRFMAIGYMLDLYAPDVLALLKDSVSEEIWAGPLTMILEQKAVFAALALALASYAALFVLWLFGLWPMQNPERKMKKSGPSGIGRQSENRSRQIKFTRK